MNARPSAAAALAWSSSGSAIALASVLGDMSLLLLVGLHPAGAAVTWPAVDRTGPPARAGGHVQAGDLDVRRRERARHCFQIPGTATTITSTSSGSPCR